MVVEGMLRRRGFRILSVNPKGYLVFPPDWDNVLEEELYGLLKKYSFRIFIRDVIKYQRSFGVEDLLRYSGREWVERYLGFLLERGVIDRLGEGRYRLNAPSVFSFGDTLEWFVAQVFEREFSMPSLWGVKLEETTVGGDYDVVASLEGKMVYVEVKSSPPKHVEEGEIMAFLDRVEELVPAIAIFLEDTRLRMKDKVVPLFEVALRARGVDVDIVRLSGELFSIRDRVFIINSEPDLITNLSFCLRHYLRGKGFWG